MTQPTPEQLRDPQWWDENAGTATHYCTSSGQFLDWDCCVPRPKPQPTDAKPESQEWVDGLPPVDSACKYYSVERSAWRIGRVIAHRNGCAVIEDGDGVTYQATPPDDLRPLKIDAVEAREQVIDQAMENSPFDCSDADLKLLRLFSRSLYDAGLLRKGCSATDEERQAIASTIAKHVDVTISRESAGIGYSVDVSKAVDALAKLDLLRKGESQ